MSGLSGGTENVHAGQGTTIDPACGIHGMHWGSECFPTTAGTVLSGEGREFSGGRGPPLPRVPLAPSPRALWGLLLLGATRDPQVGSHHTVAGGERLIINPSEARGHGPRSTSSADGPFPSARWRGLAVGGISGAVD